MVENIECRWKVVLPGALLAGLFLYAAFRHWAYDDPFITYRYAENLRSGLGFVYNPGERVLSTTTPLYALLLAGLGYLWSDLPHLSNLISAVSLAIGGVFLYLIGQRWRERLAGLVAAALLPFFPLSVNAFGAETCFYVMLTLGAFALHACKRHHWAMTLAALVTLTRADGVLVAIVLGIDLLITYRQIPWRSLLLFIIIIAPWYIFSWIYFGSPFPVTLAAKQHQGQMTISESFARGFLRLLSGYARKPLYWLHGTLALLGLGYAFSRAQQWLSLLAWGALYFLSYTLLGVTRYFWYYVPLVPVFLALVGLGIAAASRWLPPMLKKKRYATVVLVVLLILLLWPQLLKGLRHLYRHPDPRARVYRKVGLWLMESTPPCASVGTLEVGIIGYYAQRRMVDFAGLVQPDVAQQMRQETTYQDTASWSLRQYEPTYLVLNPDWFPKLIQGNVSEHCVSIQIFEEEEYSGKLIVYRCDWAG